MWSVNDNGATSGKTWAGDKAYNISAELDAPSPPLAAHALLAKCMFTYKVVYDLDGSRSYTAEQICRMFQVSPSDVWLRERYGGRAFFPSADGTFSFGQEHDLSQLEVEGTPVQTGSRAPPPRSNSPPRQPLTLSATASSSTPRSYPDSRVSLAKVEAGEEGAPVSA